MKVTQILSALLAIGNEPKISKNGYVPPKVWTMNDNTGGKWASINRPDSGARHEKELPVGDHPLQLYSLGTPNGKKVTILLEELLALGVSEAEYDAHLINFMTGDHFGSGFVDVNPNSKIPALVDRSGGEKEPINVFESGNILLYLAEKFGHFIPTIDSPKARSETLNWLFWLHGSAPYLGGGFGHFYNYAPEKFQYPIDRFTMETKRQLDVLDKRLEENKYLGGDEYSIADIATWPWYGMLVLGELYDAATFLDASIYTNVQRWAKEIQARPAVQRGRIVNRITGEEWEQVAERHSASDIDEALAKEKK